MNNVIKLSGLASNSDIAGRSRRTTIDLDVDGLVRLAEEDPENFSAAAQSLIEEFFANPAIDHEQLRRLQFRIDAVKYKSRTPLKSCLKVSELMWEKFLELNAHLQTSSAYARGASNTTLSKVQE